MTLNIFAIINVLSAFTLDIRVAEVVYWIKCWFTNPGPGCSKLTTSLVNVSLTFQMLISEIC